MNETTYNMAMFGKEYLDKAIDGIQLAAPKVLWYLQWKCHITSIKWAVALLIFIIFVTISYKYYKHIDKKLKEDDDEWTNNEGYIIFLIVISILLTFYLIALLATLPTFIISLTPICPIEEALKIGSSLIT